MVQTIKAKARSLAQTFSPELLNHYRSHRLHAYFRRRYGSLQDEAYQVLFEHGPAKVLSGPFVGMPYLNEVIWGPITPKWIGSYEAELHGVVEQVMSGRYSEIVNIGCAEGYYAVGLAWRIPNANVVAFDLDPIARKQTARLASLAGVADRVDIRGNCRALHLDQLIGDRTILVIDIEGSEIEVLNPETVPSLARASFFAELHRSPLLDLAAVADTLQHRFEPTHNLRWYSSESREPKVQHYQSLWGGKIPPERFAEYLDEGRLEPQRWLWAQPKAGCPC